MTYEEMVASELPRDEELGASSLQELPPVLIAIDDAETMMPGLGISVTDLADPILETLEGAGIGIQQPGTPCANPAKPTLTVHGEGRLLANGSAQFSVFLELKQQVLTASAHQRFVTAITWRTGVTNYVCAASAVRERIREVVATHATAFCADFRSQNAPAPGTSQAIPKEMTYEEMVALSAATQVSPPKPFSGLPNDRGLALARKIVGLSPNLRDAILKQFNLPENFADLSEDDQVAAIHENASTATFNTRSNVPPAPADYTWQPFAFQSDRDNEEENSESETENDDQNNSPLVAPAWSYRLLPAVPSFAPPPAVLNYGPLIPRGPIDMYPEDYAIGPLSLYAPAKPPVSQPKDWSNPFRPYNPYVTQNGSYYGQLNQYGIPKTVYVHPYLHQNGTYVRDHYRSLPRR